ncbi:hypothetical protein V6M85_10575 [Sulfolobus tengchongensis]|uniref:Cobalt transport protein n=1 Tax=Sulfolobus tengchongensis TaxID=207809 RepID=A0AAX4KYH7_9CREN
MKVKIFFMLIFSILVYISSIFFSFIIPFLVTLFILYRRTWVIVIEIIITVFSFFLLHVLSKASIYEYTLRALTLVNVFLISSDYTDRSSIIDLFGYKGIPIVIAFTYYPRFYEIMQKVSFYARIRRINLLNLKKILLPIIVEIIKIADNLYVAYTVKLFGEYNYNNKKNLKPAREDILFLVIGVSTLCLSLFLNI